jgi:hypothetical protein
LAGQAAAYGTSSGIGAYLGSREDGIGLQGGAIAGLALKYGKGRIDEKVANNVGKLLVSRDPAVLDKLTKMAAKDSKVLEVLRVLNAQAPKLSGLISGQQAPATEMPPLTITRAP